MAQKKLRRYVPNTNNPEDKYIHLNDWPYYKELEFIVPYVKYAASKETNNHNHHLNPTTNDMDVIIKSIEEDLERQMNDDGDNESQQNSYKVEKDAVVATSTNPNNKIGDHIIELHENLEEKNSLLPEDTILKEFFENMLKSTLKLPKFHQNRIKKKLIHCINEQTNVK